MPSDLSCFVVLTGAVGVAAEDGDKRYSDAIGVASMYFLGRLDGHAPQLDLEEAMAREVVGANQQTQGRIIDACIASYRRRLKEVMEVTIQLEKRGI